MSGKGNSALMGAHPGSYTRSPGAMYENLGRAYQKCVGRKSSAPDSKLTCKERGRRYVASDAREIGPIGTIFLKVLVKCMCPERMRVVGMHNWDDRKRVEAALAASRQVQPGYSNRDAQMTLRVAQGQLPEALRVRALEAIGT